MIYLDHHATTPVDARVLEAMLPFFSERFGNAASKQHRFGWDANDAVERARKQIATLIGAGSKDIVFTSGATEANNLAIKGVARAAEGAEGSEGRRDHIVTIATEHKAVLDPIATLQRRGWRVTVLPVPASGIVDRQRGCRRDHGAHGAGERDGGEQRDWRVAADQGDCRGGAREGRVGSHRRGAGGGQGAVRCRGARRRLRLDERPQGLRTKGRRRVVCPQKTAGREDRRGDRRRRAGTRHAVGHVERAGHRRLRQGGGDCPR